MKLILKGIAITIFMPHVWILIWIIARTEGIKVRDVLGDYKSSHNISKTH